MYRASLVVTSGGQDWRPVQTSSLEGPGPSYQCLHLVPLRDVWLASGRYASYWKAFLLGKETQLSIIYIRYYTRIQSHSDIIVTLVSKVKPSSPNVYKRDKYLIVAGIQELILTNNEFLLLNTIIILLFCVNDGSTEGIHCA